ncbi:drug/metabolite exporter YedA [Rouxiella sp. T17]|uniref:drug/metabolite exporter YedA n=1 Tax=Rouxiella sp. T17 TaxID=3085684 RepID=UPI002FCC53E6
MSRSALRNLLPLIASLFALYFIWGSTYLVIRVGVESWPPLMMAGFRFLTAGILMFVFLLLRGHKVPALREWIAAGMIGILLLAVGNGLVTVAEHLNVPSGIAAVMVATVPLFTLCFSRMWGMPNSRIEWAGVALGLFGIVLLNTGSNLNGNPWGALLILMASLSWAFGSVLSSRVTLPKGLMAGAAEMLVAGVVLLIASRLSGEHLVELPSPAAFGALAYLVIFGSMIAVSAYMYLLKTVRPAIATSYAYVNPIVAVLLGIGFAGESLSPVEWVALGVILGAVLLVTLGRFVFKSKVVALAEAEIPTDTLKKM